MVFTAKAWFNTLLKVQIKCKYISTYVGLKSCLFNRSLYKHKGASSILHLTTQLKFSLNYIAASVNTDYNKALITLKKLKEAGFSLGFVRLNDITIHLWLRWYFTAVIYTLASVFSSNAPRAYNIGRQIKSGRSNRSSLGMASGSVTLVATSFFYDSKQ